MTAPPVPTGLRLAGGTALVDGFGSWLIINQLEAPPPPPPIPVIPPGTPVGTFRFLKDHYVDGEYILAGEIRFMYGPWSPSPDVEPLDATAVGFFYANGPRLPGVWRTIFTNRPIYPPATYWVGIGPNLWALTGLGAAKSPISAILTRFEDKEV